MYISPSLLPRIHFKIFGTSFRLNMKPSHKACLISVALFESAACELLCFEGGVRDWINGVRDLLHIQHPLLPSIHVLVVYVYSLYCMFRKSRFETGVETCSSCLYHPICLIHHNHPSYKRSGSSFLSPLCCCLLVLSYIVPIAR